MLLDTITETILENGLKIICLGKPGAPVVAMQLWYQAGSIAESKGIRGITHFLEHVMFRGSKHVAAEEHSRRINDVGGHCNAYTTEDTTVYTNSVPSDHAKMVLELEADRMDALTIDPALFEIERKVIIEEYHTYMNNPVARAFLEFRQAFFRNHPYANSPLGVIGDIETVSVQQCRDYYEAWYRPDNAVLVVVGDIESGRIIEWATNNFQAKQSARNNPPLPEPAIPRHTDDPSVHRMKRVIDFEVPLLIIGYPAPPSSHEDAVALELLQLIIAGGESSRLHREVVRRQSAAVMTGGMNHLLKHAGMSMFFAAFTPDMPVCSVERALEEQIERIRRNGVTPAEIEKVRNTTLTGRTFELYSAENICNRLGYSECIEGDYRAWVKRLDALKHIDNDRLIDVARRYWSDAHRHVLHIQPRTINPLLYVAGIIGRVRRIVRKG